ncbi:MAG: thiosulfate oxidation carrier complex protein SoxZ [Betaproteobacteria bacterium]
MAHTILTVPAAAKSGEIIELRALIQHPMETGYRRSSEGVMLPRDLIHSFTCRFLERGKSGEGELLISATLHAAISANPFLSFHTTAYASGTFVLTWSGDNGFTQTERAHIAVR